MGKRAFPRPTYILPVRVSMTDTANICPHCHGTGRASAIADAEIDAQVAGLRAACIANDRPIIGADRVDEPTAAWLLGRSPGTLRNWRAQHRPIPFRKPGGRVTYAIADLARWMNEGEA